MPPPARRCSIATLNGAARRRTIIADLCALRPWLIKKIPHSDVARCCLAMPQDLIAWSSSGGSVSVSSPDPAEARGLRVRV
jgi:hypothetical protein